MITLLALDPPRHLSTGARSGPPKSTPPKPAPPPPPGWRRWLLPIGLLLTAILLFGPSLGTPANSINYNDFVNRVNASQVKSVTINDKGAVTGTLTTNKKFTTQIPTGLDNANSPLEQQLLSKNVQVTATRTGTSLLAVLLNFLPLLLLVGFFVWSGRRAGQASGGIFGVGRSRAKITDAERPSTRFSDVAGQDGAKEEIGEVVDFLRHPERYHAAGAQGPRGVLMVGPPGTGKTLLARAVAGEADVPFLSESGSGFVELFVGVGASRVRDMFAEARKRSPSIIFIDEIDAIGGKRGGLAGVGTNDEREQTLNQLLAEMDGFDQTSGVVVLAATNRPEVLDAALLRAGRFDRQVSVGLPTQAERAAILAVHTRGKHLADDADLMVVARGTPGFSGADLANLINEAAIRAVRAGRSVITAQDLDTARDRIILGRRDAVNALLPEERHSVAVHEAGHALAAVLSPHADPVAKVTILPSGMALGVTEQLPEQEHRLYTEAYLTDSLTVRLGGRAAELVVLGHGSTGAANDLSGATSLAERMVREFGLSPALGPVGYASDGPQYLAGQDLRSPSYAPETQRIVDQEVGRLLREAEARAVDLLATHRSALDRLIVQLLEHETIDGRVVSEALNGPAAVLPSDHTSVPQQPVPPVGLTKVNRASKD